jgi:FdrA protein
MKKIIVDKSTYLDSVSLMRISRKAAEAQGVKNAMVAMATDTNLLLLGEAGFDPDATPNDLLIAVDALDNESLERVLALVRSEIKGGSPVSDEAAYRFRSLDGALKARPDINLVFISVPGRFAAGEAEKALRAGKHVMIFSDNVSVEDEIRLKAEGRAEGLLVMGPDCGTAIINGVGLGFANAVPRGRVGIVSASGTGAQEVSSVLARLGRGISQLIGTGGRDVSAAVGGTTMKMGLEALIEDKDTEVIVIISKVPDDAVSRDILGTAGHCGKPCIVWFAGLGDRPPEGDVVFTRTLAETAGRAAGALGGEVYAAPEAGRALEIAARQGRALGPDRKFVRGLMSGGTLGQEAAFLLGPSLGELHTNMHLDGAEELDDPFASTGHTIVDLGDDAFTRGRAHPMIDQSYRLTRIAREYADPATAVILMDVVLGYGCNMDPGGEIAAALKKLGHDAAPPGRPAVVVGLCGTNGDPQDYARQKRELESAGAIVADTNELACRLVLEVMSGKTG